MKRGFLFGFIIFLGVVFQVAFADEFRYDSHGKRDPFSISRGAKVKVDESGSKINLKLEGVVVDPSGRSVAIVNGEMVSEGDKVGGLITVKKITSQGVEFESEGKAFSIPIVTKDE